MDSIESLLKGLKGPSFTPVGSTSGTSVWDHRVQTRSVYSAGWGFTTMELALHVSTEIPAK